MRWFDVNRGHRPGGGLMLAVVVVISLLLRAVVASGPFYRGDPSGDGPSVYGVQVRID